MIKIVPKFDLKLETVAILWPFYLVYSFDVWYLFNLINFKDI